MSGTIIKREERRRAARIRRAAGIRQRLLAAADRSQRLAHFVSMLSATHWWSAVVNGRDPLDATQNTGHYSPASCDMNYRADMAVFLNVYASRDEQLSLTGIGLRSTAMMPC